MKNTIGDIRIELNDFVAVVEICRPPLNFFDAPLIKNIADAFDMLDETDDCRALVLASEGKHFCAGANFSDKGPDVGPLYEQAARVFASRKPVVAAVQGSAIGGGLGVALVADFRVASPETRFAANFVKLGIHPGFGLTYTLPKLIGQQNAYKMFLTGRRIGGEEAFAMGLADVLAPNSNDIRAEAVKLAREIAANAPLAVESTRATLRGNLPNNSLVGTTDLVEAIREHTAHEAKEQIRLFQTKDHKEGIASVSERREGNFSRT